MKLMNKDEYIVNLTNLVKKITETVKDYTIHFKTDDSREDKNGSLTFTFAIKNSQDTKAKEYKIALYIFEGRKSITSFIVNGRTLNLLFENSTMNSPDVALHYLNDILESEIKWVRGVEETVRKQKDAARKKRNDSRKTTSRKVDYNKNGSGKRPSNGNYNRKPSNNSYSKNNNRRSYSSSVNISTIKNHTYSKTGGKR